MVDFGRQPAPLLHSSRHENGQPDEINIAGLSGAIDHGGLSGRDDDDHTSYHTNARGDARYPLLFNRYNNLIHGHAYKTVIAGTWEVTLDSKYMFNHLLINSTQDLNDEIEYEFFAEAGVKTFELVGRQSSYSAIFTVYLDDVSIGTIDQYNSSSVYVVTDTLSCTVVGTKLHSLKFKATSKNASSSNYAVYIGVARIF